jgi:hypothetical protein
VTEYFRDHVRIESVLFDGVLQLDGGFFRSHPMRAGLRLEQRERGAARFRAA